MIQPELRERFLRFPQPARLGNLASSLAHAATSAGLPGEGGTVDHLLDECKAFIEWSGPDADPDIQPEMARMQVDLARWQRRWALAGEDGTFRDEFIRAMRENSDRALEWSGLLAE